MNKMVVVKRCWDCPLWMRDMNGMYCGHPAWVGNGDELIVTQENLKSIPKKCPLRSESLLVEYVLEEHLKAKANELPKI